VGRQADLTVCSVRPVTASRITPATTSAAPTTCQPRRVSSNTR